MAMVGGTAAIAGCGSDGGNGDGDDDADGSDDEGSGTLGDDAGESDDDEEESVVGGDEAESYEELESATWNEFEFRESARYEYEFFVRDEAEGTLLWDVQEVDGDTVTVHVEYDDGETEYESTVTGDRETVQSDLLMTPAGGIVLVTVFSPMYGGFRGERLETGNEWSHSSPEGSARYTVTGSDEIAGVPCYETVIEIDGETVHEGCINPDLGLSLYSAFYDEGGLEFEIELVSFEAG